MKKFFRYMAAIAPLFSTACAKEELVAPEEGTVLGEEIYITAGMPDDSQTKVNFDPSTLELTWGSDKLRAYGFDEAGKYLGYSDFSIQEGYSGKKSARFKGNEVAGAVKYNICVYNSMLSHNNGIPYMQYDKQTITSAGNTENMRNRLLLTAENVTKETAINGEVSFQLRNSILKLDIQSYPADLGEIRDIIWNNNAGTADEQKMRVTYQGKSAPDIKTGTIYFCFDPTVMELKKEQQISFTFMGSQNIYKTSLVSTNGKAYQPGFLYTASFAADATTEGVTFTTWEKIEAQVKEGEILVQNYDGTKPSVNSSCGVIYDITGPDEATGYWTLKQKDGQPILNLPKNMFMGQKLSKIILPSTLETIGDNCFRNCTRLTDVVINDGLQTIGIEVFNGCKSLKNVTIGEGITELPVHFFHGCENLVNVTLPSTLKVINSWAFYNCDALTAITIPDKVVSIGTEAFYSCGKLATITISPKSDLMRLDEEAFAYTAPKEIYLPETLQEFGNASLLLTGSDLKKLTYMGTTAIPEIAWGSMTTSDTELFLNEWWKENGVTANTWGNKTWRKINFVKVDKVPEPAPLPGNVKPADNEIWVRSFYSQKPVLNEIQTGMKITVSETINQYGYWVYTLPAAVTEIPAEMFMNARTIDFIVLPESVTTIGARAFSGCKDLKKINLPESITMMKGEGIFKECTSLKTLSLPSQADIQSDFFLSSCSRLEELEVKTSKFTGNKILAGSLSLARLKFLGKTAPVWTSQTLDDVETFKIDLILHTECSMKGNETMWYGYNWKSIRYVNDAGEFVEPTPGEGDVTIAPALNEIWVKTLNPEQKPGLRSNYTSKYTVSDSRNVYGYWVYKINTGNVTEIEDDFFRDMQDIAEAILPTSVKKIRTRGFGGCNNLKHVSLPEGLEEIHDHAFHWCNNMTSIEIPSTVILFTGAEIFDNCSKLTELTVPANAVMNDTDYFLTDIGDLKEVTFKNSTFKSCSNLVSSSAKTVRFLNPTAPDWSQVGMGSTNSRNLFLNKACNVQPEGKMWNSVEWLSITLVEVDENLNIISK